MTNSRQKGKRGELELVHKLHDLGFPNARRGQQFKGTKDSPDVVDGIPGVHIEVKRVQKLNLRAAMDKAVSEAEDLIPMVAHRPNGEPWNVTIRLNDIIRFSKKVLGIK